MILLFILIFLFIFPGNFWLFSGETPKKEHIFSRAHQLSPQFFLEFFKNSPWNWSIRLLTLIFTVKINNIRRSTKDETDENESGFGAKRSEAAADFFYDCPRGVHGRGSRPRTRICRRRPRGFWWKSAKLMEFVGKKA